MACKQSKGRGRGVLALTSYEPCPRPSVATIGQWHQTKSANMIPQTNLPSASVLCAAPIKSSQKDQGDGDVNRKDSGVVYNGHVNGDSSSNNNTNNGSKNFNNKDIRDIRVKSDSIANGSLQKIIKPAFDLDGGGMIAKYSFTASPGQPGGFEELSLKAGEKLTLIRKGHKETNNDKWWEVRNEAYEQGFVPASYCYIIERTPTSLPWLENKRLQEEQEAKKVKAELASSGSTSFGAPQAAAPRIKEYVSAYANKNVPAARTSVEASKQYYCEICDKNLNGPQPYKMHMSSKAHREEVEYQQSKNS